MKEQRALFKQERGAGQINSKQIRLVVFQVERLCKQSDFDLDCLSKCIWVSVFILPWEETHVCSPLPEDPEQLQRQQLWAFL